MSKVTKNLANFILHTLSGVVLVAILLVLAVAMSMSLPRVQTFVAQEATEWLNRKCGVNISIGAISLENITNLTAERVYIEDLAGDTLLWVGKLRGKIDREALLSEGKFVPYDIEAKDSKFYLRNYKEGGNNIDNLVKHITSAFPTDTPPTTPLLRIERVSAENFHYKLYDERLAGRTPPTAIDYSDMDIIIASADFGAITIDGKDVIFSEIENINAVDKSGAELHESSIGSLLVGWGLLDFEDIDFLSGGSHLILPSLTLRGEDWEVYKDFCNTVRLTLHTTGSTIEPLSAGKWVAELGTFGLNGSNITGTFDGLVNDFEVDITATLYDSEVVAKGSVKNIEKPEKMTADVNIALTTTPSKAANIYRSVLHEPLPKEAMAWIEKFDTMSVQTSTQLLPQQQVQTTTHIDTNLGSVEIDGRLEYGTNTSFEGTIRSLGVNVGALLGSDDLGGADATLSGKVQMEEKSIEGNIEASVERFGLKDYDLQNIDLRATLSKGVLQATLFSHDSNALLYAEGRGSLLGEEPEYNLNLNIERLNFGALGIGNKEQAAWLAGDMDASLRGSSLDQMVGRAMINNLTFATATDTLSTELVNISLSGGERDKSFSLYSPTLDVEYRSTASYGDVLNYLTQTLPSQLPLSTHGQEVQPADEERVRYGDRLYAADDHTAVSVTIKEGERLAAVLLPNADLAPDSSLSIEFSPKAEEFSLLLESDYVAVDDIVASRLRIEAGGAGENINLEAECEELLSSGLSVPDITLSVDAKSGNEVELMLFFSNADAALSGQLSTHATLSRTEGGKVAIEASIDDSYITSPLQRWNITAPSINLTPEGVFIDNFRIENPNGGLFVNGEISPLQDRGLELSLRNVLLDEWLSIASGVKGVAGVLNGNVELFSILKNPYGGGELTLSELSVEGVGIDPLEVGVEIPKRGKDVLVELSNRLQNRRLAEGSFNYSTGEYRASLNVDELDLSLLNPLTAGLAENIRGRGAIDLDITGKGERLNIDGKASVEGFGAKVGFTGAEYSASEVVVQFEKNRGTIRPIRIEDGAGGWADAEGFLNLANLSNVEYGISLVPHNLVVLDLGEESSEAFYGKVYASGGVHLSSRGGNTEISGAVRTGAGSVFNLPLTGNSDFAGADFVTFVDRSAEQRAESNELVARKKNERAERKAKPVAGNTTVDVMLGVDTGTLLRIIIDPETENVVEARGVADLGIAVDERKNEFAIRGDYEISEGVYNFNFQNLITKQFTINPNSYIRWNGNPLDANIDVGATLRLKTSLAPLLGNESTASRASTPVECIVNLTGSLSRVDVSFDINVPNANTEYQSILSSYFSSQEMMATQFVYLLTLGNFYSDSSSGQTNTAGAASSAIGLEFLATQVSQLVSNDAYKFNLNYKAIDDTSSSYSIDFQTEIIDDRLLLELEANVDTGTYYQMGGDGNQLSGGGAVTLLLDDTGDFYLKGFSRTIDRFDENQGLQENGVGLYYKRSFNRLSDLWRKKKRATEGDSKKSGNFVTTSPEETNQKQKEKNK